MRQKSFVLLAGLLFVSQLFYGQSSFPYDSAWKKIDLLLNKKGLPQSALTEVNKVYAAAKKDKREDQWIKAAIYRIQLTENGEDQSGFNLKSWDSAMAGAPARVKAILQSAEAEALRQYQPGRYYRNRGQTTVTGDSSSDISTWPQEKITRLVTQLFLQSLSEPALLKQMPLKGYEAVLIKGNTRKLRPTLYDLLVVRAIDFFSAPDAEKSVLNPIMATPQLLASAQDFCHARFTAGDSSERTGIALRLYQDILLFHTPDGDASAFVNVDIDRISFAYSISTTVSKDSLYLAALARIGQQSSRLPVAAQAGYLRASWYSERAGKYDPLKDTTNRFDLVTALSIAGQVASLPDSSEGRSNGRELMNSIRRQTLQVQSEKVNLPGIPFRILATYKNVKKIYGRIIRIIRPTGETPGIDGDSQNPDWNMLRRLPAVQQFGFVLPETNDYQQHRAELPMQALPVGQYAILTSSDSLFSAEAALSLNYFFQSSIAYVRRGADFFLVDRMTGMPLNQVEINSYHRKYDYKTSRNLQEHDGRFVTDASGHFHAVFTGGDDYSPRTFSFSYGKDFLISGEEYNYSYTNRSNDTAMFTRLGYEKYWLRSSLFIDRGIYRPGQTVFVKSVLMTRDFDSQSWRVATGVSSKLYLLDVNGQVADSVSYTSGEYGSFASSFNIPQTGLTGNFEVRDSVTMRAVSFSVEEYKRPKFFVKLDTVKGIIRLNDSVHFTGAAVAFAGNAIGNAKVAYRIYREARYPYPWYFRAMPSNSEAEMAHGIVNTDEQGRFRIPFFASPDPATDPTSKPVFSFRISVSVTDENGETREGSSSTAVSAQSFQFFSTLPQESSFVADSLVRLPVTTHDANGIFVARSITVSLYSLMMPDRMIRERYWEQPDIHLLDQQSYVRLFPSDEYADETTKSSWKIKEKIAMTTAMTNADGFFRLPIKTAAMLSGWYLLTFSAVDKSGDSIIDKRWILLGSEQSNRPAYPLFNAFSGDEKMAEPGTSVTIRSGSSAASTYVIRARVPLEDSLTRFTDYQIKNEIRSEKILVSEADRGGFAIQDVFVSDNRWYSDMHIIHVPWTNKALEICYSTWKDKTLPGSKETWALKVMGANREKKTAEILTAMYDASLDEFQSGHWALPSIYPGISLRNILTGALNFTAKQSTDRDTPDKPANFFDKRYDQLIQFPDESMRYRNRTMRSMSYSSGYNEVNVAASPMMAAGGKMEKKIGNAVPGMAVENEATDSSNAGGVNAPAVNDAAVAIRKNFNETAFFFPDLHTDPEGNVSFSFTMPEALTKWKWSVFAHTKDLAFGMGEKFVVTQKDLMLMPNMPRFLRQGDSLQIPVKISNLSDKSVTGKVKIDWRDAGDSSERNTAFGNRKPEQPFSIPAGQSRTYFFATSVSKSQQLPVYYRLVATTDGAAQLSDGEEGILPVLSNRKLVTETLPVRLNKENTKTFDFDKLLHSDSSKTLQQHSLTVEYTTRPAWYAVQALPYLMEFPYECAEQTFDRYYANALGQEIVGRVPGMAGVMAAWKSGDSSALQSNLEKNEELKTVLLKETPWVTEGQTETAQKQNLARLLDKQKLADEMKKALAKLKGIQSAGGGFPWFVGGRDDRYITQYIVSGIGHLIKLKAMPAADEADYRAMALKALAFLDGEIKRDYDNRPKKLADAGIGPLQIQYLYMRSFFQSADMSGKNFPAVNYYRQQAQQHWVDQNMYLRGMIALFLNRNGNKKTAQEIVKSLRENAIRNEKDGTYWKRSGSGYYWQESPVETQSLLIEAFAELGETGETDNMKWWLLQQKQTTHWNSTKSTADACYALLMNGSDWLGNAQDVMIQLGPETVKSNAEKTDAGTGYFKHVFPAEKTLPALGHITVTTKTDNGKPVPSFGAVYWQYFEDLDKISSANTALNVTKMLFVQQNTDKGVVGQVLAPGAALHVGDKLILRFIIKTDRDLSYVQLQDQRAACLEPVDALSGYQWKGDVGYYQAPGDESTSFFFDFLSKGTHVVEYPVYVTTNGVFSAGISTLQTMYAPEFAGHTAGSRLQVTDK